MGILLMYDVTSLESFNNLSYWLRNIQEVRKYKVVLIKLSGFFLFKNASPDVVKILAGNKCECNTSQRAVDKERGEKVHRNGLL